MHEFNSSRILLKVEKDKMSELLAPIVEEILFFCGGRVEAKKNKIATESGSSFYKGNQMVMLLKKTI